MSMYTEAEYRNAKDLVEALNDYYEAGHLIDINADVLINKIGRRVFGDGVFDAMWEHMRNEKEPE